jgi:tetratricopeptide (TPR) repeat protein
VNLQGSCSIRLLYGMLAVGLCLAAPAVLAQSTTQAPASQPPGQPGSQKDNPFPGDAPQAPAPGQPVAGQGSDAKPDSAGGKPKRESENPFPGEDPGAPIIPVEPGPGAGAGSGHRPDSGADSRSASRPGASDSSSGTDSGSTARRDADPDGDPVRSPDGPGHYADDDGFSSSRSGVKQVPVEDLGDATPSKSAKGRTREQVIKEDLDVGGFYLDKKNWKAAQARFSSAFALDAENPDSVWGLAEAERHLQLYKEAGEHYKLFLSYEPDGKRGREARKALAEVEAAQPSASAAKTAAPEK